MKTEFLMKNEFTGMIILDNPPYNNLDNPEFCDYTQLKEFLLQPELKAVIIKGAGRNFCGGADIDSIKKQIKEPAVLAESLNRGKALLELLRLARVPVGACIKGSCFGAGLEIALSCHFRFASTNAMIGFPESGHLLFPGFSGTQARIGQNYLIEMILSGDSMLADEAREKGIIHQCFSTAKLEDTLTDYLSKLVADKPAYLVHAAMESIANSWRMSRQDAVKKETELFIQTAITSLDL